MKKLGSILLLLCVWILPVSIFLAFSHSEQATPLEGSVVTSDGFLSDSQNTVEVVFFGYAECAFICPTSVSKLADVIYSIKEDDPEVKLGGYFLDVNAASQLNRAHQYSQFFSPDIVGVNLNKQELNQLKRDFGIQVKDNLAKDGEINHTDHFYVLTELNKNWSIHKVISNDVSTEKLQQILTETQVMEL